MTTGIDAIQSFLTRNTSGDRLIIKNKEIHIIDKGQVSFWNCLKAKFGCGNASMKKIARFVHENRNNLFPQEDKDTSIENRKKFNEFIENYNRKNAIFKSAKKVGKIEAQTITFFGKEEWAKVGIDVKDAPPIPANLKQLYKTPCPIWGDEGKTIGDTHMVVLVPKMLGDKKTTINRLKKMGEKYIYNPYHFHIHERVFKDKDGHGDFKNSYWILMTKDVIPHDFDEEHPLNGIPDSYECPSLIEANVCMLSQYLRGRNLTDKSTYLFHEHFIICSQKNIEGTHAIMGNCDEKGFALLLNTASYDSCGLAVLKKL